VSQPAPRSGCPSHDSLLLLLSDAPSAPSAALSAHLSDCAECRAFLDERSQMPDLDRRLEDWRLAEQTRSEPRPDPFPSDRLTAPSSPGRPPDTPAAAFDTTPPQPPSDDGAATP
jgi:hypothetical protein